MVPPHELVPAAASDVSVRTYNPFRLEPSLPAPSENPSTHDPLMERVIPTDAQISTFSELEGAVYHFAGPLVDMARVVVASRLDPRWDLEAVRRMTRDCLAYAGKQQPLSRASLELRAMEETVEVSEVEVGSGDEDRERDESETTWSRESGCWRVAPMPTPRPMEAARGLHPMPVVIPQTDGDALSNDKDKSTTSTHEVDNPAGEPVIELVPLSSGGPMTSWSADDQPEAPGPEDAPQPQSGNPYPKPTAVIDETVYGSDPPRCQPCNKHFVRASDRKRHIETHSVPSEGLSCDWCQKGGYSRQDAIDRHKRNNCPHKARYVSKKRARQKWNIQGAANFGGLQGTTVIRMEAQRDRCRQ